MCWGMGKIKGNERKSVGVWGRCGKVCWGVGKVRGETGVGVGKCWGEAWESV